MSKQWHVVFNSLRTQLLLSLIALVLLSAAAIGLPAIWLLRDQLDRQAWAQVDQGSRAAQALYLARQNEVAGLAVLTAQRPSLRQLVQQADQTRLLPYLTTLQTGASLDLVLICGPDRRALAQVGQEFPPDICGVSLADGFYVVSADPAPQIWLVADRLINQEEATLGRVVVGVILADRFARRSMPKRGWNIPS